MAREKCITLFNKNHITVKKYENREFLHGNKYDSIHLGGSASIYSSYGRLTRESVKPIKVKKISTLAPFYYEVEEYPKTKKVIENSARETTKILVYFYGGNNSEYEISYYIKYNDVESGPEMRPWDIVEGDGIFDEHFIKDLYDVLKNIFIDVNIDSMKFNYKTQHYYTNNMYDRETYTPGSKVRIDIMKSLFGDKDGYKQQTNNDKILAHGFDLKTSFRKPKEK